MNIDLTPITGVLLVTPKKFVDERGFFSETYKESALRSFGVEYTWVQDNHSLSRARGVMRGLHFQAPPSAQAKLIRVARGSIFDVVVDLRRASPTFGQHFSAVLSAEDGRQMLAPVGVAHGFMTLEEDTEVLYKTSHEYAPKTEGGLHWLDPALDIKWPIDPSIVTVNARDRDWPTLARLETPF